ncbi:receptor-type tyrosine-protein phosphatase F-like [Sycon ciliatum]|uniref:receptor-type tyrosine-protein phosphatase F-like n=1 Tax=Sycon ciliatum TaxID=27933 RepID=UPI0031F6BDA0
MFNGKPLGYRISYGDQGAPVRIKNVSSGTHETTVSGLIFDTSYTFSVAAVSSGGIGPSINQTDRTTQQVPPAPTIISTKPLATEVTIHLTRVKGNYHLSNFCCYFTRQSVSDIHMSSLPSVMICNKTSPVVFSPVEEDATYTYHCVARNTYNASDGNATEQTGFSTTATAPSVAPEGVHPVTSKATSVLVGWQDVDPYELNGILVTYNVICRNSTTQVASINTSASSATVSGLIFNTVYTVSVAAISTGGHGDYSDPKNVTTLQDVPGAPTIISRLLAPTKITVVFDALTGHFTIQSYCCLYKRQTVSGFPSPTNPTITCNTSTTIVLNNLEEDSTYIIVGYANNAAMARSPNTPQLFFNTTTAGPSEPPASVSITDVNRTSLSVVWNEVPLLGRNGPITHYLVKYNSQEQRVEGNQSSAKLENLRANADYNISVSAIGHGGQSGPFSSEEIVKTLEAVPNKPTVKFTSTSTSVRAVVTSESPYWNVLQYCITIQATKRVDGKPIPDDLRQRVKHNCTDHGVSDFDNLEEYIVYNIWTWVQNGRGENSSTQMDGFATKEGVPSRAPSNLAATGETSTSAQLQWSPIPLLDQNGIIRSYHVNVTAIYPVSEVSNQTFLAPALSGTFVGLKPYTMYEVGIAAATNIGRGDISNFTSFQTQQAAPSIGPTVTNTSYLSSTALQLAWRRLTQQDLNGVLVRYDIMIVSPANYSQVFNVTSNETSLTITQLEINTVYNLSVRAVTEAAPGPFGSPVPQRTDESIPGQPTANFSSTSATITGQVWVEQGNFRVSRFCIQATLTLFGTSSQGETRTTCSKMPRITLLGLQDDTAFSLVVFVNNTNGRRSPLSRSYTVRTLETDQQQQQGTSATTTITIGILSSFLVLTVLALIVIIAWKRRNKARYIPRESDSPRIPLASMDKQNTAEIMKGSEPTPQVEKALLTSNDAYGAVILPCSSNPVKMDDGAYETVGLVEESDPVYADVSEMPSNQPKAVVTDEPLGDDIVYETTLGDCIVSEDC